MVSLIFQPLAGSMLIYWRVNPIIVFPHIPLFGACELQPLYHPMTSPISGSYTVTFPAYNPQISHKFPIKLYTLKKNYIK